MPLVIPFRSLALENETKLKTLNFRVLRAFGVGGERDWGPRGAGEGGGEEVTGKGFGMFIECSK